MADVQHKRGTRAALDVLAGAGGLLSGQIYLVTDEGRTVIATSASAYTDHLIAADIAGFVSNATHTGDVTGSTVLTIGAGKVTPANLQGTAPTSAKYYRGDGTWNTPTDTVYTEITEAEITAGSASTARAMSGRRAGFMLSKAATFAQGALADTALQPLAAHGLYPDADKTKLSGIAEGATANATDTVNRSRSNHTGTQPASTITGLATVATTGAYANLSGLPTIPTLAAIATAAQIRSLTTATTMTPEKVKDAAAPITPSGGSNYAPDWAALISADWVVTANRVLSNPTNVIPGTTRAITIKSSTATERTVTFGANYRGDLPTVAVTNSAFVTLFLYAASATQILVSDKAWT